MLIWEAEHNLFFLVELSSAAPLFQGRFIQHEEVARYGLGCLQTALTCRRLILRMYRHQVLHIWIQCQCSVEPSTARLYLWFGFLGTKTIIMSYILLTLEMFKAEGITRLSRQCTALLLSQMRMIVWHGDGRIKLGSFEYWWGAVNSFSEGLNPFCIVSCAHCHWPWLQSQSLTVVQMLLKPVAIFKTDVLCK